MRKIVAVWLMVVGIGLHGIASAQQVSDLPWQECPCSGDLGNATVDVPAGMLFLDGASVPQFMEMLQNPSDGQERGVVLGETESGESWFVIFSFNPMGYIKDDEKDSLDADAIIGSIREGTEAANKERRERGWSVVEVKGWQQAPFYDDETNNLTWAILGGGSDGDVVNHSVRLLGRRGVMSADLVTGAETVSEAMPAFDEVVAAFDYKPGERYREFTRGDRVAEIGLTALVAGGAGAALAKSGFLKSFGKAIAVGVVALLAAAKKLMSALFGRRAEAGAASRN
jgi:uncharacterized membrane-anchored protein